MRFDVPETGPAYEVRAVTISWARAMWVGFWFAWGIALAWRASPSRPRSSPLPADHSGKVHPVSSCEFPHFPVSNHKRSRPSRDGGPAECRVFAVYQRPPAPPPPPPRSGFTFAKQSLQ